MLGVVAWLWHDADFRWQRDFRYGPAHVRALRASVARNLRLPHEFVLVTDRPDDDYGPGVRTVPLWPDHADLGGCWRRLRAFDRAVGETLGRRFVWMDLDAVVVGDLTPLLDRPEDFVAWRDVNPPTPYCGSMVMMTAGCRQRVWDEFDPAVSARRARGYIGTDQAWIGACLGPNEATWGPEDGVYNFRHTLLRRTGGALPDNARVVYFTGPCDPSQADIQRRHAWVREHWRE